MAKNKVKFGLKNVHYALITEAEDGTLTFGKPAPWRGAVNLSLSAQGDTENFYADDMAYYIATANDGYQGDLESALIPDDFRESVLGETMDETAKVLVENAQAEGASFALLFEFSADAKAVRHVMYNCKATRPNVESQTQTNSRTPVTETVQLTASPLADGRVKAKTTDTTPDAVYSAWYNTVWEPGTSSMEG